jgi:3-phosphoshikimate 1-carboxyvinyltransferase
MLLSYPPLHPLTADITLDGSKSISNRALIALALAGAKAEDWLTHLSSSKDTVTLHRLLNNDADTYDAGDAGTTFRFLTAFLAIKPGYQVLTGSARMRERPIGGLVNALRDIGANIEYLEQEGYPPLRIGPWKTQQNSRTRVRIHAGTSSQFLSALLLIGPYLPGGLALAPEGELVSRPYLDMTLQLMRHFGAQAEWVEDNIQVEPGQYTPRPLQIEADWSAASYWYAMAALAEKPHLRLRGLFTQSWQGDSILPKMMQSFGVQTLEEDNALLLQRDDRLSKSSFEWDFLECPDIAQTLAVVCAGRGVTGLFSGLETLSIKETDRVAALKAELAKIGVSFAKLPARFSKKAPEKTFFICQGKASQGEQPPRFATYGDHRMAMAFAPLALIQAIEIEHPEVVSKSYPAFWDDLRKAGFVCNEA